MRLLPAALTVLALSLILPPALASAQAPDPAEREIVLPEPGREVLRPGVLEGAEMRDYTFSAESEDRLTITLEAETPSTYFDLIPPGTDLALHNGSVSGNRFEGVVPQPGLYTLRLYLGGAAQVEGRRVAYDLVLRRDRMDVGSLASEALAAIEAAPDASGGATGGPAAGGAALGSAAIVATPLSEAGAGSGLAADVAANDLFEVANLSGSLNLRAAPSATAAVLATALLGTVLINRGCEAAEGRNWCQVQTDDGTLAWAAESYLVPAAATPPTGDAASSGAVGAAPAMGDGDIACTVADTSGRCSFGVERREGGSATITVRLPDGGTRAIFLEGGVPASSDAAASFYMIRRDELSIVSVGDAESYEIPDAIAVGG